MQAIAERGRAMVLALATTTTALVAGVFYGYSVSVNPALARLPDRQYLAAMQAINEVIQNPLFAASFFGAPLLLPLATVLYASRPASRRFGLLSLATVIYLVGSFGVTVAANIPLNETLARFPVLTASLDQAAAMRAGFAEPWNRWHDVRALASTVALILAVGACLMPAGSQSPTAGHSGQH